MRLILGSASPRRAQILKAMGYEFEVVKPDIDEKAIRDDDPERLTLALANAKADAVMQKLNDDNAIIIASDQVVEFEGRILEKPESLDEARVMLKNYGGKIAETITSVVVWNTKTNQRFQGVDAAQVAFDKFSDELIETMVHDPGVDVLDRAGGYAAEHPLFTANVRVTGEMESVMGLPKALAEKLLKGVMK